MSVTPCISFNTPISISSPHLQNESLSSTTYLTEIGQIIIHHAFSENLSKMDRNLIHDC